MAAASAAAYRKHNKPKTYGKSPRGPVFNFADLEEDGEVGLTKTVKPKKTSRPPKDLPVRAPSKLEKETEAKLARDTFDVPSSEDETDKVLERPLPPRTAPKRLLHLDKQGQDTRLAPWEQKKVKLSSGQTSALDATQLPSPRSDRTSQEHRGSTVEPSSRANSPKAASKGTNTSARTQKSSTLSLSSATSEPLTAAARLAARKKQSRAGKETAKTSNAKVDTLSASKKAGGLNTGHQHEAKPLLRSVQNAKTDNLKGEVDQSAESAYDIYDVPTLSSDGTMSKEKSSVELPRREKFDNTGKFQVYVSIPPMHESLARPEYQGRKLPKPKKPQSFQAFPSVNESMIVEPPTTPREARTTSPQAPSNSGTMTPKQAEIWKELLHSDSLTSSSGEVQLKNLTIGSHKRLQSSRQHQNNAIMNDADAGHGKRRLVEQLKASATSSSESEDSDNDDLDTEMLGANDESEEHDETTKPLVGRRDSAEKSDGQPQATSNPQTKTSRDVPGTVPKITYGKVRSYLADESIEEGLLDELPSTLPERLPANARRTAKAANPLLSSPFDLEDSDDHGSGDLRSIHELRAAGRNQRLAQDIEALMADITDRSVTNRGRRRGALIELASKLSDKTFAERLLGQGIELELARECKHASDDIVEFALAAVMVLILAAEPSEHAIWSIEREGLLDFFVSRLTKPTGIAKLAKDRKNNLAKATQSTLVSLVDDLKGFGNLWGDCKPVVLSTSLLSLRSIDFLICRLRRLGDKTEILDTAQVSLIFNHFDVDMPPSCETSLAVSILESLSTLAKTHAWPMNGLKRLGLLIANLIPSKSQLTQHTAFLALRLYLNVTNEKAAQRNQKLATPGLISSLLCAMNEGLLVLGSINIHTDRDIWAKNLDSIVLTTGVMNNLAEYSGIARQLAAADRDGESIKSLASVFRKGQKSMMEAESVEESTSNVAFGYLGILLANLCIEEQARSIIAQELRSSSDGDVGNAEGLEALGKAVEEFVLQHQTLDMIGLQGQSNEDGENGSEVWGAFTERLKGILERFKQVAGP